MFKTTCIGMRAHNCFKLPAVPLDKINRCHCHAVRLVRCADSINAFRLAAALVSRRVNKRFIRGSGAKSNIIYIYICVCVYTVLFGRINLFEFYMP